MVKKEYFRRYRAERRALESGRDLRFIRAIYEALKADGYTADEAREYILDAIDAGTLNITPRARGDY